MFLPLIIILDFFFYFFKIKNSFEFIFILRNFKYLNFAYKKLTKKISIYLKEKYCFERRNFLFLFNSTKMSHFIL
jgi:hypothetical protein